MKFRRTLIVLAGFLLIGTATPELSQAQWGIGGSYEIRDEDPKNGFGVRLERGILQKLPLIDLGLRAHFSYFSDENNLDQGGVSYSQEITDYDYGVTALAGVNVGLVKPYIGLGLGANTVDVTYEDAPGGVSGGDDSKIYWNGLVGAELSALPVIKPFVEYRYTDMSGDFLGEAASGNVPESSNGRMVFGVLLSF